MSTVVAGAPVGALLLLSLAALLLLTTACYLLVESFVLRQEVRVMAAAVALLLASSRLSRFLAYDSDALPGVVPPWEPYFPLLSRLPLWAVVALLGGLAVVELQLLWHLRRVRASRITADSVKEAIDALPDGVCFALPNGQPLLVNARMDALVHDALGMPLGDEALLWRRVVAGDCLPGWSVRHEVVDDRLASLLLTSPHGRAWELRRRTLALTGSAAVETVATDVTGEQALTAELAHRNETLLQLGERLRAYGDDIIGLTREEEVLAAKIRVHDEVGRALVALRVFEQQDPGARDRAGLLDLWQGMATLLQSAAVADESTDAWAQLVQAARAVDVELVLEGALPPDEQTRGLVVTLVHECLNNAVRHAGAHEVCVRTQREGNAYVVQVTNDGTPPVAPAAETGGLANLRTLVNRAGGTMDVRWTPNFALVARLAIGE